MSLLRGKRLAGMDEGAARFTASVLQDGPLLEPTVRINQAHIVSLGMDGVLDRGKAAAILSALEGAMSGFAMDPSLEDVHMNLEAFVAKSAGEAGGYMNLGKSRNDQVSTALRMRARQEILGVLRKLLGSVSALLDASSGADDALIPGYTHLQVAQPTTLSHYLLCYAEALLRDAGRLADCYGRVNLSPMGSAAFAGTTVNVNRRRVAELLGFDGIVENTMDAVSARDFMIEAISAFLIVQLDLSRLAEDLIFYSSSEASYITIPDAYASTSSIMPQKKNAAALETVRAKASSVLGMLTAAASLVKGLPQSYDLDLQEMNSLLWKSSEAVMDSLSMVAGTVRGMTYDAERSSRNALLGFGVAADLAETLCVEFGIQFRAAHHMVGAVAAGLPREYTPAQVGRLLQKEAEAGGFSVPASRVEQVCTPQASIALKKTEGSPNPSMAKATRLRLKEDAGRLGSWLDSKEASLARSTARLAEEIAKIRRR